MLQVKVNRSLIVSPALIHCQASASFTMTSSPRIQGRWATPQIPRWIF